MFGSVRLEHLQLTANFRSTPSIVDWVNNAFERRHAGRRPGARWSEVSSLPKPAGANQAPLPSSSRLSKTTLATKKPSGSPRSPESISHSTTPWLCLVRARSHVVKTIQAFRKHGIAYEAREIDELQNEQHILDVLSLTRAVLHVGDRLSWLACLRAPWCGLTLADLSALVEGQRGRSVLELL